MENRKACIVVVNKWDLYEESVRKAREEEIARRKKKVRDEGNEGPMTTLGEFGNWVQEKLFFLDYAPGDFHFSQVRFSSGSPAGSGALCGRAVTTENSDVASESHPATTPWNAGSR